MMQYTYEVVWRVRSAYCLIKIPLMLISSPSAWKSSPVDIMSHALPSNFQPSHCANGE